MLVLNDDVDGVRLEETVWSPAVAAELFLSPRAEIPVLILFIPSNNNAGVAAANGAAKGHVSGPDIVNTVAPIPDTIPWLTSYDPRTISATGAAMVEFGQTCEKLGTLSFIPHGGVLGTVY